MKNYLITGFDSSNIARSIIATLLKENNTVYTTVEKNYKNEYDKEFENFIKSKKLITKTIDYLSNDSLEDLIKDLKNIKITGIVNTHSTLAFNENNDLIHEFFDFDYNEFKKVLDYNILSVAKICIGLKDCIEKYGSIVNVTSTAAEDGAFATISYNASKAALINLTKSLANNLGNYNEVRVNTVSPGWIPQNEQVVSGGIVDLSNKMTPIKQLGKQDDVASAILFLLENKFINKANIKIDGGLDSSYLMYLIESSNIISKENNGQKQIINDLIIEKQKIQKEN